MKIIFASIYFFTYSIESNEYRSSRPATEWMKWYGIPINETQIIANGSDKARIKK